MTRLEKSQKQVLLQYAAQAALNEPQDARQILKEVQAGHAVILRSAGHACTPVAVGKGLRIKVNANIGTSSMHMDPEDEL